MQLDQITGALINRAVEIYLEHAYRSAKSQRPQVQAFAPDATLDQILKKRHPFEDLTGVAPNPSQANPVPVGDGALPRMYALPLGHEGYPNMKLALVEVYYVNEFVFAVDRHDTFHFDPKVPGYEAWGELKEINRYLKEAIEGAWHREGLPTLIGLREKKFSQPDLVKELREEGQVILLLDDDTARADIMGGILKETGYEVMLGPPGPGPDPKNDDIKAAMAKSNKGESLRLPAQLCRSAGDVDKLAKLAEKNRVALIVLDMSFRTGQGPRVAGSLRVDDRTQDIPILGIYSRRDFGPDPDIFNASLRRPYRKEALLTLVEQVLMRRSSSSSGLHKAI